MIHASAVIDPSARLGANVGVGAFSVISADVQIDIIGVMPLPAATSRKSASSVGGTNVPDGASTCSFIPG